MGGGLLCVQDIDLDPVLEPIGRAQGLRSVLAVAVPAPAGGLIVLAHTDAAPRGFTTLCQSLGTRIAEAASIVAHTAALREELRSLAEEQGRNARRDALTGLGNRLTWDEALERAQARIDSGGCVTVVTLDVDGLKHVNDNFGHPAGDELLRRCADIVREHGRENDVMVRLGGDEFALLLPIGAALAARRTESLRASLSGVTSREDIVAASLGTATATPGTSIADAVREADADMYTAKRARRASRQRERVG